MTRPFPPYAQREREAQRDTASTLDGDHGRIERRTLTATTGLTGYSDWPGLGQVMTIKRERTIDGNKSVEFAHYATSLSRADASAERLLKLARKHWGAIENGLHWIRDEAFGEDRSPIFCGDAPQNLAALRNAGINCLRQLKIDNVTATLRSFARQPFRILRILGYPN